MSEWKEWNGSDEQTAEIELTQEDYANETHTK